MKKAPFIIISVIIVIILGGINQVKAATLPSVSTLGSSKTTATTATMGGVIIAENGAPVTERGFYYNAGTGNPYPGGIKVIVGGISAVNVNYYYTLSNLNSNTQYSYVAYAVNSAGTNVGTIATFKTRRDAIPPKIISANISWNNSYMDVYFNEYVYSKTRKPLIISRFIWQFRQNGGTATAATVTSITKTNGTAIRQGDKLSVVRFNISVTGIPSGLETFQIWPSSGASVYDASDNPMTGTETTWPIPFNDPITPHMVIARLANDNSSVDITMSEGVYGPGKTPLNAAQFRLIFTPDPMGEGAESAAITGVKTISNTTLVGGENTIRVFISITGIPNGYEFVEIRPANGASIYNVKGNPMDYSDTTGSLQLNDKVAPVIMTGAIASDNSYIDITFDHGVFGIAGEPLSTNSVLGVFYPQNTLAPTELFSSISNPDGTPLLGNNIQIRLYLKNTAIPLGTESIAIYPFDGSSIYDLYGNAMRETQTTGRLRLFYPSPVNMFIHSVKNANNRTLTNADKYFIPGDHVPLAVKIEFRSTVSNPVIVIDLTTSVNDFYLKEICTSTGVIDINMVKIYKNNNLIDNSKITVMRQGNLLRIGLTETFAAGDVLNANYIAQLKLSNNAIQKGARPAYGAHILLDCYLEWGSPVNTYSSVAPSPTGNDLFKAEIIVGKPDLLE